MNHWAQVHLLIYISGLKTSAVTIRTTVSLPFHLLHYHHPAKGSFAYSEFIGELITPVTHSLISILCSQVF